MKPIVAIVGRPNVGKSTLFNRILGSRVAIVDNQPGVTRDRHYANAEWNGKPFILVDTGGLDFDDSEISKGILKQATLAITESDLVLFLVDGRSELTQLDFEVASILRKSSKRVILAVNKIDDDRHFNLSDMYQLGVDPIIPISSAHSRNIGDLLDNVVSRLSEEGELEESSGLFLRIAIVGQPNVGKSTLINALVGEERAVVSEVAGTTRDCIDIKLTRENQNYLLVDTAGMKRKSKTLEAVERFSTLYSLRAIERCDLALMVVDLEKGVTHQDRHLANHIWESGKALIIVGNKTDCMTLSLSDVEKKMRDSLGMYEDLPLVLVSAKENKGCEKIFDKISFVKEKMEMDLSTSALNKLFEKCLFDHHIPMYKNKEVKFYYAAQVKKNPRTIMIYSNYPQGVSVAYRRYLVNRFKEIFGPLPLHLVIRKKV